MSQNLLRQLLCAIALSALVSPTATVPAATQDASAQVQQLLTAGDYEVLKDWMRSHGAELSAEQRSALLYAQIRQKQPTAAAALLDLGFDPHAQRADGVSAAMLAAYYGDASLVERLINAGADPVQRAPNGYALFDYALEAGQADIMRLLIDRWLADQGQLSGDQAAREAQSLKLARAIIDEDYDRLEALATDGGLNSYNRSNYAPLPLAVRLDKTEAVNLLLAQGAYASIGNDGNDEAIPLNQAARGGRMEIARQLLQWQASPNKPNGRGYTAVMLAAMYGHTDMLRLLLDNGGRPLQDNIAGDNAMTLALQAGNPAIATLLLDTLDSAEGNDLRKALIAADSVPGGDWPATMDATDAYGIPAGFYAMLSKQPALLSALLERGASPNQQIQVAAELSLLHLAVILNRADLIDVLLEAGADRTYVNARGLDAKSIAKQMGREELVLQLSAKE